MAQSNLRSSADWPKVEGTIVGSGLAGKSPLCVGKGGFQPGMAPSVHSSVTFGRIPQSRLLPKMAAAPIEVPLLQEAGRRTRRFE